MITLLISIVLIKSLPHCFDCVKDACKISLNGYVRVGFDCLKGVSHFFLYELKGCRHVLCCWCHDLPRAPQTLSAGQGQDIRTDGCNPNVLKTPKFQKPDPTTMEISEEGISSNTFWCNPIVGSNLNVINKILTWSSFRLRILLRFCRELGNVGFGGNIPMFFNFRVGKTRPQGCRICDLEHARHYCTPFICVPDVIGLLMLWRLYYE